MPDRTPLAVLVGGAPGSGKSTLADALGVALDLPVLHKDVLVHGRWRTLGQALDLGESGVQPFFQSMELWANEGISFIAEETFYPGISEHDIADRLVPLTTVVLVHCRSHESFGRWERRMRADPLCGETRLRSLIPKIRRLNAELVEPLDINRPTLVVDTDDGYAPSLEALVLEIDTIYSRPKIHEIDRLPSAI